MRLAGGLCAGLAAFLVMAHITGHLRGRVALAPLRRRHRSPSRAEWLRQAGVAVTPTQFHAASGAVAMVVLVLFWSLSGSAFVALVPGVVASQLPRAYFGHRRSVLLGEVVQAWPDGIRHIIATARARGTVHQALVDLSKNGPEPVARAFERYPVLARATGPVPALEMIREELADPTSDRVIEVLIVAQQQGQQTAIRILRDLAAMVTEDLKALEEIRSAGLEQKINSRVAFVLPWLVLVALCLPAGAYRDFYRSPAGAAVVLLGGAMSLGGMAIISALGRPLGEQRVLGAAAAGRR